MKTIIIGDSCCDLPGDYLLENQVPIVHYMYLFKGQEYFDDFGKSMSYRDFYHEVRLGEMPTTSQVNVHTFEEIFEKYIKEGYAVIYVSFSSALSNTFANAVMAGETIRENMLERISLLLILNVPPWEKGLFCAMPWKC